MTDELDLGDPIKGLKWVESHIGESEYLIALGKKQLENDPSDGDALKSISRLEFALLKWGELAQKYQYQMFQQGKTETDVSVASKKKARVNASRAPS